MKFTIHATGTVNQANIPLTFKRYQDGCYSVVLGNRRGPCAHDKPTAKKRYKKSGLIAYVGSGQ